MTSSTTIDRKGANSSPTGELLASVIVAIGPKHNRVPSSLNQLLSTINKSHDVELVVVDDHAPQPVRDAIAALKGRIRIRHGLPLAYGSDWAPVAGARIAAGEILLIVPAELDLSADAIERVTTAFSAKDAPDVLLGTDADGAWMPVYAITKSALQRVGGLRELAWRASEVHCHDALPIGLARSVEQKQLSCEKVALFQQRPHELVAWQAEQPGEAALEPPAFEPLPVASRPRSGVNMVGLFEAACGVGDAARRYAEALSTTRIEFCTYSFHWHSSPSFPFEHHRARSVPYDINLLSLNPDTLIALAMFAGSELWSQRYTIGVWFWELDTIGEMQRQGASFVNEIWVSTGFLRDAFRSSIDRSVTTVPLPVRRRDGVPEIGRSELKLPNTFVFLTMFDFNSLTARKNSLGAVQAFTRAFAPGEGPTLVIKALNGASDPQGKAALDAAIGARRDIVLIDQYLDDEVVAALIGQADCFVSLHRAEGFGLSLADAMAWGRPVIATGYSGNLEFMTRHNSYLVDYDLVAVPSSTGFYPAGAHWAEPRIEHAAALMRHVVDNQGEAAAVGARAQRDIRLTNSTQAAARVMNERINNICDLQSRARTTRPGPRQARAIGRRTRTSR